MKFDFSRTDKPINTAILSLLNVYKLNADSSYDVAKNLGREEKELIALRTVKGSGIIKIEGFAEEKVTGNTLILFEHNKVRRYACEHEKWDFWWFSFNISGALIFPINNVMEIKKLENEEEECQACMDLLRNDKSFSKALASSKLSSLIYGWMYNYQFEKQRVTKYHDLISEVISDLHKNLDENITVSQMAKNSGLSERRFREVFKEHAGKQPKSYYEGLKMQMAAELLQNTSLSIVEISDKLGYQNQFYFSRAFKNYYGISPSKYGVNNIE